MDAHLAYRQPVLLADVYQEHALYEGTGYDWWGQHWTYEPGVQGQMPTPGYRVITDITKWQEEVKFPDLDAPDWEGDAQDPERPVTIRTGRIYSTSWKAYSSVCTS